MYYHLVDHTLEQQSLSREAKNNVVFQSCCTFLRIKNRYYQKRLAGERVVVGWLDEYYELFFVHMIIKCSLFCQPMSQRETVKRVGHTIS